MSLCARVRARVAPQVRILELEADLRNLLSRSPTGASGGGGGGGGGSGGEQPLGTRGKGAAAEEPLSPGEASVAGHRLQL